MEEGQNMLLSWVIRMSLREKVDVNKGLKEGRMLAEQDEKPEPRPYGGSGSVVVFLL